MTQADTIAELEARATRAGVPLYKIAKRAGISPSTIYRWKTGSKASHENVLTVIRELEAQETLNKQ